MKGGKQGGGGRSGGRAGGRSGTPARGGKPTGGMARGDGQATGARPPRGAPKQQFGGSSSRDTLPPARGAAPPAAAPQTAARSAVTVQRTLNVPASAVIRAINDPDRRGWAPQQLYRVVSLLAPRFIRLAFPDGTLVAITVTRQGNARCTVSVELTNLPAGTDERALHERWAYGLTALQDQLDSSWD
ncbi:hypothetical protein [Gemmatimonas sp.]|jgi:hypothetical protein|uniref:hypothetical protein n=1 Tax=Gemmatimonas sp. TaxID=1962908 RepID=UPI0037C12CDD